MGNLIVINFFLFPFSLKLSQDLAFADQLLNITVYWFSLLSNFSSQRNPLYFSIPLCPLPQTLCKARRWGYKSSSEIEEGVQNRWHIIIYVLLCLVFAYFSQTLLTLQAGQDQIVYWHPIKSVSDTPPVEKSSICLCSDTSPSKILLGKAQARKKLRKLFLLCCRHCLLFILLFFSPSVFCRCLCLGHFFLSLFSFYFFVH